MPDREPGSFIKENEDAAARKNENDDAMSERHGLKKEKGKNKGKEVIEDAKS